MNSSGLIATDQQAALNTQVARHVASGLAASEIPAPKDVLTDIAVDASQSLTVTLDQGVLRHTAQGTRS